LVRRSIRLRDAGDFRPQKGPFPVLVAVVAGGPFCARQTTAAGLKIAQRVDLSFAAVVSSLPVFRFKPHSTQICARMLFLRDSEFLEERFRKRIQSRFVPQNWTGVPRNPRRRNRPGLKETAQQPEIGENRPLEKGARKNRFSFWGAPWDVGIHLIEVPPWVGFGSNLRRKKPAHEQNATFHGCSVTRGNAARAKASWALSREAVKIVRLDSSFRPPRALCF